jgi:hypothetical protein
MNTIVPWQLYGTVLAVLAEAIFGAEQTVAMRPAQVTTTENAPA